MMYFDLESRRKIFHICSGISAIFLIQDGILNIPVIVAVVSVGFILSMISKKVRIPVIGWFLDMFDRKDEKIPGKGALNMMIGIGLLLLIFGKSNTVYASIMILALGDSFACLVGRKLKKTIYLKKTKHPFSNKKLLEGTIFGFVIASLGAMLFVSILSAVVASAVAMTIEGLEWKFNKEPIDDNISIPLVSGLTIHAIRFFF